MYVEKLIEVYLCTKFEGFILIYEAMDAKNLIWPTFGSKLKESDLIVWNSNSAMCCGTYQMDIQSSNWYLKACWN